METSASRTSTTEAAPGREDVGMLSSSTAGSASTTTTATVGSLGHGGDGDPGSNDRSNALARSFEELLDAEVSVNPAKLREASRAGIPPLYRSPVYLYLLGVAFVDKSREMSLERMLEKDFEQLLATFARIAASDEVGRRPSVKGRIMQPMASLTLHDAESIPLIARQESRFANGYLCSGRNFSVGFAAWIKLYANLRYLPRFVGNPGRRQRMEAAWQALHVTNSEATPDEVDSLFELALVFESVHSTARDIYFSTASLYHLLTHHGNVLQSAQCLQKHCGTFLMLFRATNFDLYRHFVAEGVTVVEWLPQMLKTLLAGRLHEEDLLRLWDVYLAGALEDLSCPLHPYVCLAILAEMTEVLLECEKSGIIERLRHLPRINAGCIIQKAVSLKESVFSKNLL
ncbi:putative GTPase activating protein [Trypanosoma rangeli]|uniref:TBC1 domain family member 7 n=1 Tax=Trypanosoma rangeli TaxID=5698 RepID=A0A422NHQ9_TRYRA|nr:putative GTPase activating protein [Trypanosoma rangeli]RNF04924.1 putative GTPase activating protein [Trypanosoma rangeli]|eukprot:RNF04924.1 putative GTPase activating protein [Trypanosoma rangeli]